MQKSGILSIQASKAAKMIAENVYFDFCGAITQGTSTDAIWPGAMPPQVVMNGNPLGNVFGVSWKALGADG